MLTRHLPFNREPNNKALSAAPSTPACGFCFCPVSPVALGPNILFPGPEFRVAWGKDPELPARFQKHSHGQDYNRSGREIGTNRETGTKSTTTTRKKARHIQGFVFYPKLVSDWREAQTDACPVCRCSSVLFFLSFSW